MVKLLALVAMTAACLPKTYHCASNTDCGTSGVCQSNGFCSFVDSSCSSGFRYGDLSSSVSDQCVGTEPDIDAQIDTSRLIDAPPDVMIDAARPFCDTADTTLGGCWQFENDVTDASGHANNGTATSVTYAAGQTGMAAVLTAGSHIAVPGSASLDGTGHLTIEGWINPSSLPTGTARMGIVDDDGRYGLFLYLGEVRCLVSVTVSKTITLPTSQWTHIACTYDGATGTIYINGSQAAQTAGGGALGAPSGQGVALGGNSPSADTLVGMIDQFRIFTEPRTAAEICRDAGMTTCP